MTSRAYSTVRIALVTIVAAAIAATGACTKHRITTSQVNAVLARTLPVGSSPQRVVIVLDSLKIEHSAYDLRDWTLRGTIRRASKSLTTEGCVQLQFAFDEHGRLVGHTTTEGFTGP